MGKVAFDAVGLGVGPPCFRVDSEDALQKRTDERALLARAAPGVIPEMKLVTKFWMMGRRETTTDVKSLKYEPQMTTSVWMPFNQTCDDESGDADFDSFKTAPWEAGGMQRDEVHETMCRAMVHDIDRSTTKNTECVFTTNMLLAKNCPRLQMTPGEDDASHRGTQIGGDLHDTLAVPNGHNGRKDDDILRHSTVCMEVDIPADMNCTVVELSDVTILRRRLPQRQDSAEHQECCIMFPIRQSNSMTWFSSGWDCRGQKCLTQEWRKSILYQGQIPYQVNRMIGLSAGRNCRGGLFSPTKTGTVVIPEETLRCPNRVITYTAGGVCHRTEPGRIWVA